MDTLTSLGEFLEVLHDAALVVDRDCRIVLANRAVTELFGYVPTELVDGELGVLIPPESRAGHARKVHDFMAHGRSTPMGERPLLHGLHRDGHRVAISISLSNVDLAGVRYAIAVVHDASAVSQHIRRALAQAETDPLTGLGNRRHLMRRLEEAVARGHRRFTLAYLDLAGFKAVNDRFGHATGDEVLRIVAQRLRSHMRDTDTAARLGGDEFVLLFDGLGDPEAAAARAQAIAQHLAAPIHAGREVLCAAADIGTASFPLDGRTPQDLLARADEVMYLVKRERMRGGGSR